VFGLAKIRGQGFDDVERQVEENAKRFLGVERLI
jgi:hypothetical protein